MYPLSLTVRLWHPSFISTERGQLGPVSAYEDATEAERDHPWRASIPKTAGKGFVCTAVTAKFRKDRRGICHKISESGESLGDCANSKGTLRVLLHQRKECIRCKACETKMPLRSTHYGKYKQAKKYSASSSEGQLTRQEKKMAELCTTGMTSDER